MESSASSSKYCTTSFLESFDLPPSSRVVQLKNTITSWRAWILSFVFSQEITEEMASLLIKSHCSGSLLYCKTWMTCSLEGYSIEELVIRAVSHFFFYEY